MNIVNLHGKYRMNNGTIIHLLAIRSVMKSNLTDLIQT